MSKRKALSSNNRTYLAMTIPIVILFFLFNTLPLITGAVYSFTNYRGYGTFDFVGLRNYIDLFSDERVLHSYLFTFKYAIAGTILINCLSLLLAMGLNSRIRCKSLLRGVYFVPNILGGLIVGYIFSFIFTYIIPALGKAMHIGFLENSILASEKYAWIGVLVVGVWQAVAMNTIIYISGLQTVPADIYEAGMIDGANPWQKFWKLTFPMLLPFVSINLILSTKNMMMVFDQIMALTKGGPDSKTETVSYLIFQNGLGNGEYSYQMANAVTFFIVLAILAFVQLKFFSGKEKV